MKSIGGEFDWAGLYDGLGPYRANGLGLPHKDWALTI